MYAGVVGGSVSILFVFEQNLVEFVKKTGIFVGKV